ncbi:hypothetical protein [Rhizobium sp. Leaf341]|uniref:hypothetical protein n=1 Tax=Rhizobium sp. Leaf341 TaxID=1736344 RepID=UPI000712D15E|nr:hypothetical protein [Rhizobium sp. Leaf341]KQR69372.1 hypothetical protein ASG03_09370 [Rhizobium sp. Leaf341]
MGLKRPFRAEIIGGSKIWIIDAEDAFVTNFPRQSDDIMVDYTRAQAVAAADTEEISHADDSLIRHLPRAFSDCALSAFSDEP